MDAAADNAAEDPKPAPAPPPAAPFKPIATTERIEALDVVRGFALLGIFLMNIEFFNRPLATLGGGMPVGLTGLDWLASFFVAYFVQGKFWTIFSLLFGMGFAVMLVRAERAGRPFVKVYLRRILALATFGAVHYIFIWGGDILFSYAVAALMLLIVLYGRWKPILIGIAVLIGLGFIPDAQPFFGIASGVAVAGLFGLYLRSEKLVRVRVWPGKPSVPIFSLILMVIGALMSIGAVALWVIPNAPADPRMPLTVFGPLLLIAGWLSHKYHQPPELRTLRMSVSIYVFFGLVGTAFGLLQHFSPDPIKVLMATPAAAASAPAQAAQPASAPATVAAAGSAAKAKADGEKPKKTPQERAAEMKAEREKGLKQRAEREANETRILTGNSYLAAVELRGGQFLNKAAGDAGFAMILIAMFLLGTWFVRSGVMERPAEHLPLFRKLALYGLSVGIGLGLVSALITTTHVPGDRYDGWGIAHGLHMLGNLPACLGYVGLVVCLLYSRGAMSRIRVLAPMGRMALTNYLMQSVLCVTYFYGFGLGHWGMPRAQQLVFVAVVYTLQVMFSHWWLARFRYGPMEWLWRGFTYRETPPLRIAAPAAPEQIRPA